MTIWLSDIYNNSDIWSKLYFKSKKKDIKYKIGSKVKDSGSIIAAKKIAIFT